MVSRALPTLVILLSTSSAWCTSFEETQRFLKTYCQGCHQGKTPAGDFAMAHVADQSTLRANAHKWKTAATRVHNGDMPPKTAPAPSLDDREKFTAWVNQALRAEACSTGVTPGPAPIRRLNRDEYAATIRDLLGINMDVGHAIPVDGAGGEGFDNAAETLFLSPIHAEKYMDAAKLALDFAKTDSRARLRILVAKPGPDVSDAEAARRILGAFLPRALRRPTTAADAAPYISLYNAARKSGEGFEDAVLFALRGVLVSPQFLFRIEKTNERGAPRELDDYELASRLSYFLWGTMPDEMLFDIAAAGKLRDPEILRSQVGRMLRSPRSMGFAQRFVEQWLRTRDLGKEKSPDPELFPVWAADEELRSDIRYQPIVFFRELLMKNQSLLNLIDSDWTITTRKLARLYNLKVQIRRETQQNLHPVQLPERSDRGGLLGMAAVLAVTSYPNRTSPVLRGAWVLDTMLGTPPPPPPPGVPPLDREHSGSSQTVRERLTAHRANPACASCHSRIDPIGFALENYTVLGQWRSVEAGKAVDSSGELNGGVAFHGPKQLKAVLMDRKDLVVRNLTNKLLGYALGRGLTLEDSCTVDAILAEVEKNNYGAQSLIESIVFSTPFRYQPAAASPVTKRIEKRASR